MDGCLDAEKVIGHMCFAYFMSVLVCTIPFLCCLPYVITHYIWRLVGLGSPGGWAYSGFGFDVL